MDHPDLGEQLAVAGIDCDRDRIPLGIEGGKHREIFHFCVDVLLALIAVHVQLLFKIALVVEQPDGHERHAQSASCFNMVARQDAQTSRIDRDRFMQPEFGRKIGHGSGT